MMELLRNIAREFHTSLGTFIDKHDARHTQLCCTFWNGSHARFIVIHIIPCFISFVSVMRMLTWCTGLHWFQAYMWTVILLNLGYINNLNHLLLRETNWGSHVKSFARVCTIFVDLSIHIIYPWSKAHTSLFSLTLLWHQCNLSFVIANYEYTVILKIKCS